MRRNFGFDVLACPRCGGCLPLLALIDHSATVERIFRHLRLPAQTPNRGPPARRQLGSACRRMRRAKAPLVDPIF